MIITIDDEEQHKNGIKPQHDNKAIHQDSDKASTINGESSPNRKRTTRSISPTVNRNNSSPTKKQCQITDSLVTMQPSNVISPKKTTSLCSNTTGTKPSDHNIQSNSSAQEKGVNKDTVCSGKNTTVPQGPSTARKGSNEKNSVPQDAIQHPHNQRNMTRSTIGGRGGRGMSRDTNNKGSNAPERLTNEKLALYKNYKEGFDIRISFQPNAAIGLLMTQIYQEESSLILFPTSSASSSPPIIGVHRFPVALSEIRKYIPRLSAPCADSSAVFGTVLIGTNTPYDEWKLNVVEWTKKHGHGLYSKYLQDERTVVVGWLHYTHKSSNSSWYQQ